MKKSILIGSIVILGVVAGIFIKEFSDSKTITEEAGLERNYGVSHMTTEINLNQPTIVDENSNDLDKIVPNEETLRNNLVESGYTVEQYDTALDNKIKATRIYAKKGESYIDITYCKDVEEAKEVFSTYEAEYSDFYLMAQNMNYAYCISDQNTFEISGFNSLANVGIQYINHDKK